MYLLFLVQVDGSVGLRIESKVKGCDDVCHLLYSTRRDSHHWKTWRARGSNAVPSPLLTACGFVDGIQREIRYRVDRKRCAADRFFSLEVPSLASLERLRLSVLSLRVIFKTKNGLYEMSIGMVGRKSRHSPGRYGRSGQDR